ncbi:MaoC family dehydratase N-terminal domain-containing protein [Streptomyces sp. NPDC047315]|uniref:FAS1-like dehydratase domain-containing protein n=1 Tax=Streptomyces sp. NPDC047315 TaxID=3155142 RepID=UPI0033E20A62
MGLDPQCVGTTYPPAAPYLVEAGALRRFAEAVGDADAGDEAVEDVAVGGAQSPRRREVPAPPTFPFVVVMRAMREVFRYEDVGFDPTYLVHGSQRFEYVRPVRAGDRLVTTLEITGAQTLRGRDVLSLRGEVCDTGGAPVVTTHMTFVSLTAVEGGGPDDDRS